MEDNQGASAPVEVPIEGSEVEGLEGSEQTPQEAVAEQKAIVQQLKKLKLKVDGKEEDLEFDPNDDEFMTRQFQLAKMGQKRAQEFASLQREAKEFFENLKKDPRKVLSDPNIGIDLKKMAAEMIEEEIANARKSPEQIEKEKLQAELKAIKDEREKEKKTTEQREYQRLVEDSIEKYDREIGDALTKTNLPSSAYTVKKMTDYMTLGLQNGIDISASDIAKLVQEDLINEVKTLMTVLPLDQVEGIVGKETLNKLRKQNLAKAKSVKQPPVPIKTSVKDVGGVVKKDTKPVVKQSYKDFFKV